MAISGRKRRRMSDEDIVKYLANRAQKTAIKAMKSLKPLTDLFVWPKKIEKDVRQGIPIQMFSIKAERKRQKERMEEIERIKKRKTETAAQRQLHEEEMAFVARNRAQIELNDWEEITFAARNPAQIELNDWEEITFVARNRARIELNDREKKERDFELDESKIRSEIRLKEGRSKPIDLLLNGLKGSDEFDTEVFKDLTVKELEEVHEDIRKYVELDRMNIQYWEAFLVICDWELADRARVVEEKRTFGLLAGDMGEHEFLGGKTYGELEAIQSKIESAMRSGEAMVVEYWEALSRRLSIYKAKAFLKEIHAKMLQKRLERLEKPVGSHDEQTKDDDESGLYSRCLEADMPILENKRVALRPTTSSEDNLEMRALKAMGAMGNGDEVFGNKDEVKLDSSQVYWWHDKYRPRKPRYSNRVHTGYDWNKYNRIHYDQENPPLKTVLGYKFNIFYPDLVDKTKTPRYVIEKDSESDDTCILRFYAGPPYEDIAFRIVNKEWDYSNGFKCTYGSGKFGYGILHLYFNFRSYR